MDGSEYHPQVETGSSDHEDRRQAALVSASLSSTVTSTTAAIIGAAVVIATFIVDNYEGLVAFYLLIAVAAAVLIRSFFYGGSGVYSIARQGFTGDWAITTRERAFNKQAGWMFAGIGLLLVAVVVGLNAKRRDTDAKEASAMRALTKVVEMDAREMGEIHHTGVLAVRAEQQLVRSIHDIVDLMRRDPD